MNHTTHSSFPSLVTRPSPNVEGGSGYEAPHSPVLVQYFRG